MIAADIISATANIPLHPPAATDCHLDFLLKCLASRAWARAYLWSQYEIEDLHDAVDPLQRWAAERGLVAFFGQDLIQQILADEFGARR